MIIPQAITTPVLASSLIPEIPSPTPSVGTLSYFFLISYSPWIAITKTRSFTLIVSTVALTTTPNLLLDILEFNSSFAIIHQMGEVENTFPIIRETTGRDLANVCVTLTASEEVRVHPGKTGCNVTLSNGYQVTFKSTIDKGIKQDSSIRLDVNVNQGYMIFITRSSCREIGLRGWIPYEWGD